MRPRVFWDCADPADSRTTSQSVDAQRGPRLALAVRTTGLPRRSLLLRCNSCAARFAGIHAVELVNALDANFAMNQLISCRRLTTLGFTATKKLVYDQYPTGALLAANCFTMSPSFSGSR
jgi:hypothetical protein